MQVDSWDEMVVHCLFHLGRKGQGFYFGLDQEGKERDRSHHIYNYTFSLLDSVQATFCQVRRRGDRLKLREVLLKHRGNLFRASCRASLQIIGMVGGTDPLDRFLGALLMLNGGFEGLSSLAFLLLGLFDLAFKFHQVLGVFLAIEVLLFLLLVSLELFGLLGYGFSSLAFLARQSQTDTFDQFVLDMEHIRRMMCSQTILHMTQKPSPFVTGGLDNLYR
jgi:hypothetical protein